MKKSLGVSLNLEIAIIAACGLGIVPGIVWGLIAGSATSPRWHRHEPSLAAARTYTRPPPEGGGSSIDGKFALP